VPHDQRLLEPLPVGRVARVERCRRQLAGQRAARLRERVAQTREHAAAPLLGLGGGIRLPQQFGPAPRHAADDSGVPYTARWYTRNARVAIAAHATSSAVRKPARVATSVQSSPAAREAVTAQLTGLKRATSWIQPGRSAAAIIPDERNVAGSTTNCTAPIGVPSCLVTSASPGDGAAPAPRSSAARPICSSTDAAEKRAPAANARPMITSDWITITTMLWTSPAAITEPR